jgi:hypothetical protein
MADEKDTGTGGGFMRWVATKAFYPLVIAVAFTLSYALADRMGPPGSVLGLGIGFLLGWAGSKWFVPRYRK